MEEPPHRYLQFHLCFHSISLKPCWPGHWSRSWFDGLHPIWSHKPKTAAFPNALDLLSAPTQKIITFQAAGLSANCWQQPTGTSAHSYELPSLCNLGTLDAVSRDSREHAYKQSRSSYSIKNRWFSHVCNVSCARCRNAGLMRHSFQAEISCNVVPFAHKPSFHQRDSLTVQLAVDDIWIWEVISTTAKAFILANRSLIMQRCFLGWEKKKRTSDIQGG